MQERLDLDAAAAHARLDLAGALAGRRVHVAVRGGTPRERGAALDVGDDEVQPLEVVELEVLEFLPEAGDVQVDAGAVPLQPDLVGVVLLGLELEVGAAGRGEVEDRSVEVEPARLIALRVARIGQYRGNRLPAQHRRAGPFALGPRGIEHAVIRAQHAVERPRRGGERGQLRRERVGRPAHERRLGGVGAQRAERADVAGERRQRAGRSDRERRKDVRHGRCEAGIQPLAFVRIARADRHRDGVGQVEHIVSEEGIVAAALAVAIVEPGVRRPAQRERHCRGRGGGGRSGELEPAAERRLQRREPREGGAGGAHQRIDVAIKVGAVGQPAADVELFVGIIAADQPVEPVAERLALKAEFLAERAEADIVAAVVRPVEDVEIVEIRVLAADIIIVAVGGDRGERGAAQLVVRLAGHAPVAHVLPVVAPRRYRDAARIGIGIDHPADAADRRHYRVRRAHDRAVRAGQDQVGRDIRPGAALLVALGIVADQPEREVFARLIEQLPAHQPAVAVLEAAVAGAGIAGRLADKAVALEVDAVQPEGERLGRVERAGDAQHAAPVIVIAVARLGTRAEIETGFGGDDADQPGRGVAAEQRALRPAQYLDPVDRAELGERGGRARAVDAVDEHRDRAFQPRIVADRADAADARDAAARFRRAGRNQQRRRELGQLAQIGRARILQRRRGDRRYGERNVGQGLVAPGRGDDDVADIAPVDGRALLDGAGPLGRALFAGDRRGLRDGRSRRRPHARGQQPP